MTPAQFRQWRERCGYSSWVAVAHDLRLTERAVKQYATLDQTKTSWRPIPASIERLCELLEHYLI